MLQIADAVREIVAGSEEVSVALSEGFLNFSAYAKKILPKVEAKTKKVVKIGSIVAALSRMEKENRSSIVTEVEIENLTTKSPLVELSYDKTPETLKMVREFSHEADFLTITQGADEITIICSEITSKFFGLKPKARISGLVALCVRFSDKYINQPNVIYSLIRKLAVKRINVVEVVSTYTELTFLIYQQDLQKVMGEFLRK